MEMTMKGCNIDSLESLKENFAPDILQLFRSGELETWLREHALQRHVDTVGAIPKSQSDHALLSALCAIFETPLNEEIMQIFLRWDAHYTKQGFRPGIFDPSAPFDLPEYLQTKYSPASGKRGWESSVKSHH
jgi:hypothetical protein